MMHGRKPFGKEEKERERKRRTEPFLSRNFLKERKNPFPSLFLARLKWKKTIPTRCFRFFSHFKFPEWRNCFYGRKNPSPSSLDVWLHPPFLLLLLLLLLCMVAVVFMVIVWQWLRRRRRRRMEEEVSWNCSFFGSSSSFQITFSLQLLVQKGTFEMSLQILPHLQNPS